MVLFGSSRWSIACIIYFCRGGGAVAAAAAAASVLYCLLNTFLVVF